MKEKRQMISAAGLVATLAGAVYMVVQLSGQTAGAIGDFTNAALAEVRNGEGHVVLSGQFQLTEEEEDGIERKAVLTPTGVDADASGKAELEFSKTAPAEQELEFLVRNLPGGAVLTFVIDGTAVGTATTDAGGRAELELDVRMPGTTER